MRSVNFFFPVYFSTSFKNQNIYLKKTVLSKLLKVTVYVCTVSKSTLEGFAPKDAARKTEFFLHTLFLKNKAQINKNNYATTLFMSKQLSLPKISSILRKIKIGPKCHKFTGLVARLLN